MTDRQRASLRLRIGRFDASARIVTTPVGLFAIGGMVTSILLGSSAIVLAARGSRRSVGRDGATSGPTRFAALPAIEAR